MPLNRLWSRLTRSRSTVYVRPLVEYCSPVWSPTSTSLINQIEAVQRRFTKRLRGYQQLDYKMRIERLNLTTLELRRLIADLCLCYKIIHGHVELKADDFFELSPNCHTRGHNYKLTVKRSSLNVRRQFFSNRVVVPWNSLPPSIVNAPSVNSFKHLISCHDLSDFINIKWLYKSIWDNSMQKWCPFSGWCPWSADISECNLVTFLT